MSVAINTALALQWRRGRFLNELRYKGNKLSQFSLIHELTCYLILLLYIVIRGNFCSEASTSVLMQPDPQLPLSTE